MQHSPANKPRDVHKLGNAIICPFEVRRADFGTALPIMLSSRKIAHNSAYTVLMKGPDQQNDGQGRQTEAQKRANIVINVIEPPI